MAEKKNNQSSEPPSPSTDLESRILNFVNRNVRVIQYSVYFLGFAGLAVIARRTFIFRKFGSSQAIPKEFIANGYQLQGKVLGITPIPLAETHQHYNILRLQIEHIPICSLSFRKHSALNVDMVGVWPSKDGIDTVKNTVLNKAVWLKLYGASQNEDIIYSSIRTKRTWRFWRQRDVAKLLLKLNQGLVASFPPRHLQFNKYYPDYYRKLLQLEVKYKKSS